MRASSIGRIAGDLLGVGLDRLGRERGRVDVLRALELLADRVDHRRDAVTDVHDDRAAGAVQVALAVGVGDPDAVRGHGRRQVPGRRPREHVAHELRLLRVDAPGSSSSRRSRSSSARGRRRLGEVGRDARLPPHVRRTSSRRDARVHRPQGHLAGLLVEAVGGEVGHDVRRTAPRPASRRGRARDRRCDPVTSGSAASRRTTARPAA